MKLPRLIKLAVFAGLSAAAIGTYLLATVERPEPVSLLAIRLARVNHGMTAAEVDKAMGLKPKATRLTDGYLLGPMTMLTPENSLTPKDQVQQFNLRIYSGKGSDTAAVAMAMDGRVVGKWYTGRRING